MGCVASSSTKVREISLEKQPQHETDKTKNKKNVQKSSQNGVVKIEDTVMTKTSKELGSSVQQQPFGGIGDHSLGVTEGIQLPLDAMRSSSEEKRKKLCTKISEYMDRAEVIKAMVEEIKANGTYHEQIKIENNAVGFSYDRLFGRFLDESVETVDIDDPYIRAVHQIYNFLRFCELLVKKCPHLKRIQLITGQDQYKQHEKLQELAWSLADEGVKLIVQYSKTIHDREIRLNTGWIIKLGRGLDIYKAPPGKFSLGYCDYELRRCHETTVDIFHQKGKQKSVAFVE